MPIGREGEVGKNSTLLRSVTDCTENLLNPEAQRDKAGESSWHLQPNPELDLSSLGVEAGKESDKDFYNLCCDLTV